MVYLVNIVFFSMLPQDHIKQISFVLQVQYIFRLTLKLERCALLAKDIAFFRVITCAGRLRITEQSTYVVAKLEHRTN